MVKDKLLKRLEKLEKKSSPEEDQINVIIRQLGDTDEMIEEQIAKFAAQGRPVAIVPAKR